jgi:hypothetical protein
MSSTGRSTSDWLCECGTLNAGYRDICSRLNCGLHRYTSPSTLSQYNPYLPHQPDPVHYPLYRIPLVATHTSHQLNQPLEFIETSSSTSSSSAKQQRIIPRALRTSAEEEKQWIYENRGQSQQEEEEEENDRCYHNDEKEYKDLHHISPSHQRLRTDLYDHRVLPYPHEDNAYSNTRVSDITEHQRREPIFLPYDIERQAVSASEHTDDSDIVHRLYHDPPVEPINTVSSTAIAVPVYSSSSRGGGTNDILYPGRDREREVTHTDDHQRH